MSDPLINDVALQTARTALDGLSFRQELIGHNLANVDTPGYQAQSVSFEAALQQAQQGRPALTLTGTHTAHIAGPERAAVFLTAPRPVATRRADGNSVDVDQELAEMAETGIRFQALTQLVTKKLLLLRSIVTVR